MGCFFRAGFVLRGDPTEVHALEQPEIFRTGANVLNVAHRGRRRRVVFLSAGDDRVGLVWTRLRDFAAGR